MSFNVLNKSGDVLFGVDNDESIIDAAIKHDVALSYGCRKGVCGACKCKIHQGNVEYKEGQPDLLTDKDIINDQALLCVAHLSEDITIDFVPPEEDELDIEIKTLPAKIKLLKKLNPTIEITKEKTYKEGKRWNTKSLSEERFKDNNMKKLSKELFYRAFRDF